MNVQHKVIPWDPGHSTEGTASAQALELRLNELGQQGWAAVGVAGSADGGYVLVMTRLAGGDAGEIQVVRLAVFDSLRQTTKRLIEMARRAQRPSSSQQALPSPDEQGTQGLPS